MNLPESFKSYGRQIFAEHPQVERRWSVEGDRCELHIPAASLDGFDIAFDIELSAVTVGWGNWHSRYELTDGIDALVEDLFGLLRDMLGPGMRIRELKTSQRPYWGYLESYDGKEWHVEQEMGLIFWNYFGKRSVKICSNKILSPRDYTTSHETHND